MNDLPMSLRLKVIIGTFLLIFFGGFVLAYVIIPSILLAIAYINSALEDEVVRVLFWFATIMTGVMGFLMFFFEEGDNQGNPDC